MRGHKHIRIMLAKPLEIGLQQGVRVEGTLRIKPFKPHGYTEAAFQVPDARVTPIE